MGGQSKKEYCVDDKKDSFWRFSNLDYRLFKKLSEIAGEVSEEEIKNHYNVYVYNVLPYPPDKKESLTKWLDFF